MFPQSVPVTIPARSRVHRIPVFTRYQWPFALLDGSSGIVPISVSATPSALLISAPQAALQISQRFWRSVTVWGAARMAST